MRKKEEWLIQKCVEIENNEKTNTKEMYENIREIAGVKRPYRGETIKDKNGNILTDIDEVIKRWEEYVKELFNDIRGEKPEIRTEMSGPPILRAEVELAAKCMKKGKAVGDDGLMIEMVETAGDFAIEKITDLANKIYNTGYIPKMMQESSFIAIPKKEGTIECDKHRTLSILSQIAKLVLRIIMIRIRGKIHDNLDENQYGFRKGKGTRNAIFVLRMILERSIEVQKETYLCFVDFQKAFDTVKHNQLIEMLLDLQVDGKDIRMITNLYWDQRATVQVGDQKTNWIQIKKGVRQGCPLSADLFSLYGQRVVDELKDIEGIKVGGHNINNIRYADDTVLVADTEEKLQRLVNRLQEACNRKGLKINVNKTEVMGISKGDQRLPVNISLENKQINQVSSYTYLGSKITDDGRSDGEIRRRIGIAKTAYGRLKKILSNVRMNIEARLRIMKCYVWSKMLYGCETWTISKVMRDRLEAAEMWLLRRMLRIPWTAKMTNEEVRERAGVKREVIATIRARQLNFLGHILRENKLEKLTLQGKIEGRRARGRQRMKYMDSLLKDNNRISGMRELMRLAEDRKSWRSMIAHVKQDLALQ